MHISNTCIYLSFRFGEIALIQNCQRTATVETSEDSTLLVLSKDNFHRFLRVVPQLSETMREHMGERISQMIKTIPFFANVQKLDLLADLFSFKEYAKNVSINYYCYVTLFSFYQRF